MKFIIDEQLPESLCSLLQQNGHDAIHVNTLRSGLKMPDLRIAERSMIEKRVVILKDVDFLQRF